jgi:hypothetical protein
MTHPRDRAWDELRTRAAWNRIEALTDLDMISMARFSRYGNNDELQAEMQAHYWLGRNRTSIERQRVTLTSRDNPSDEQLQVLAPWVEVGDLQPHFRFLGMRVMAYMGDPRGYQVVYGAADVLDRGVSS